MDFGCIGKIQAANLINGTLGREISRTLIMPLPSALLVRAGQPVLRLHL